MKKDKIGQRGKSTEEAVREVLVALNRRYAEFSYDRIYDSRSARSFLPQRPGDFEFFYPGVHGLLEAKEMKHDFRLPRDKLSQLPMLNKRALSGGTIVIVVHHTTTNGWRRIPLPWLLIRLDAPSWDLREFPEMANAYEVLHPIEEALVAARG